MATNILIFSVSLLAAVPSGESTLFFLENLLTRFLLGRHYHRPPPKHSYPPYIAHEDLFGFGSYKYSPYHSGGSEFSHIFGDNPGDIYAVSYGYPKQNSVGLGISSGIRTTKETKFHKTPSVSHGHKGKHVLGITQEHTVLDGSGINLGHKVTQGYGISQGHKITDGIGISQGQKSTYGLGISQGQTDTHGFGSQGQKDTHGFGISQGHIGTQELGISQAYKVTDGQSQGQTGTHGFGSQGQKDTHGFGISQGHIGTQELGISQAYKVTDGQSQGHKGTDGLSLSQSYTGTREQSTTGNQGTSHGLFYANDFSSEDDKHTYYKGEIQQHYGLSGQGLGQSFGTYDHNTNQFAPTRGNSHNSGYSLTQNTKYFKPTSHEYSVHEQQASQQHNFKNAYREGQGAVAGISQDFTQLGNYGGSNGGYKSSFRQQNKADGYKYDTAPTDEHSHVIPPSISQNNPKGPANVTPRQNPNINVQGRYTEIIYGSTKNKEDVIRDVKPIAYPSDGQTNGRQVSEKINGGAQFTKSSLNKQLERGITRRPGKVSVASASSVYLADQQSEYQHKNEPPHDSKYREISGSETINKPNVVRGKPWSKNFRRQKQSSRPTKVVNKRHNNANLEGHKYEDVFQYLYAPGYGLRVGVKSEE